ncbi:hypothetical protein HDU96_000928, partial [Phlyctochytrium bullatum]
KIPRPDDDISEPLCWTEESTELDVAMGDGVLRTEESTELDVAMGDGVLRTEESTELDVAMGTYVLVHFKQKVFRGKNPKSHEDILYKEIHVISKPGANKVEPNTRLTAWCDQGSTPFITIRTSDSRTFIVGSTIAERVRRLLLQQDRLQSDIDTALNDFDNIKMLHGEIEEINRKIAVILVNSSPDLDNEEGSPASKEIKELQEKRRKWQEEIGRLKTDMRNGVEEYERSRVARMIKEAKARAYGLIDDLDNLDDAELDK